MAVISFFLFIYSYSFCTLKSRTFIGWQPPFFYFVSERMFCLFLNLMESIISSLFSLQLYGWHVFLFLSNSRFAVYAHLCPFVYPWCAHSVVVVYWCFRLVLYPFSVTLYCFLLFNFFVVWERETKNGGLIPIFLISLLQASSYMLINDVNKPNVIGFNVSNPYYNV